MSKDVIGAFPIALSKSDLRNAFSFDHLPPLDNTVSLVTGANSGLGYWTSLHLASKV